MKTAGPEFLENTEDILAFVAECQSNAVPCALGVVTDVSGGSARSVGSVVAVRADGEMTGYISHGCVDADLVLQAQHAIADGQPRQIVYGVGSPYIDLRMPCGGTVEILIDPIPDHEICLHALQKLRKRQAVTLNFTKDKGLISVHPHRNEPGWIGDQFITWHSPRLQLVVAGVGPLLAAVA